MAIDFGLLGLGPIDRSLTPQNAPGDKLFAREIAANQIGVAREANALRAQEGQETQRSNLANESMQNKNLDQQMQRFMITQDFDREKFEDNKQRFKATFGLETDKFDFFKEDTNRTQDREDLKLDEDKRQFDETLSLDTRKVDIDENYREKLDQRQEKLLNFNIEDRAEREQAKQMMGQAFQQNGLAGMAEAAGRLGMVSETASIYKAATLIDSQIRAADLADEQFRDTKQQRELTETMAIVSKGLDRATNMPEGEVRNNFLMQLAQAVGSDAKNVSQATQDLNYIDLGFKQVTTNLVEKVQKGGGTEGSRRLLADITGRAQSEADTSLQDLEAKTILMSRMEPADLKVIQSHRKELDSSLKDFNGIKDVVETSLSGDVFNSRQAQISLIFAAAKANDPGGRVTDQDFKLQSKGGKVSDRLKNFMNEAMNGKMLTEGQVKDVLSNMRNAYEVRRKEAQSHVDRMRSTLDGRGIDFSHIIDEKSLDVDSELFRKAGVSSKKQDLRRLENLRKRREAIRNQREKAQQAQENKTVDERL